jgi:Fe-S cluster biogenesis protein NfuA
MAQCGCGCGSGDMTEKKGTICDIESFKQRVGEVIEEIRPGLQMDGGDVTMVDVTKEGDVHVTLTGACGTCPMAQMTLKMGIEAYLKEKIPEVRSVVSV